MAPLQRGRLKICLDTSDKKEHWGISSAGDERGSWLHHRAFRQERFTSSMGNVRFTGVPPGRIIARIKTADGTTEQRAVVSSGQELDITLRMLW